jgi:hypothetical protein
MEGVSLICEHGLSIDQRLVVVLVVKRCSRGAASADRQIRLNPSNVVILLASEDEETFQLAFTHTWLAVLHH